MIIRKKGYWLVKSVGLFMLKRRRRVRFLFISNRLSTNQVHTWESTLVTMDDEPSRGERVIVVKKVRPGGVRSSEFVNSDTLDIFAVLPTLYEYLTKLSYLIK